MQDLSKVTDQKAREKRELEMKFSEDLKHLKDEYQNLYKALKDQVGSVCREEAYTVNT